MTGISFPTMTLMKSLPSSVPVPNAFDDGLLRKSLQGLRKGDN
jgi:hypothetical protein